MKLSRCFKRGWARGFTRTVRIFTSLAFLSALVMPVPAFAGQWRQMEPKWHMTSVGSPTSATGIYQRDTTYNDLNIGQADTTGAFSANQADVWPGNGYATGSADTVVVGFLVMQSDTSVATASSVTSVTYEIDGRAGGFGSTVVNTQWTQIDSNVVSVVADAAAGGVIALPIVAKSGIFLGTLGAGGVVANHYYRLMAYDDLRVRITAATGAMQMCRVFWRYWDEDR